MVAAMEDDMSEAKWLQIDPATLDGDIATAYENYRTARKMAAEAKAHFEKLFENEAQAPEGQRVIFGYNFGKLSVALVEDDRKPAKPKPVKLSLADFIAANSDRQH